MIRTHFRPSDDSVVYAFNIPGNAMAAVELERLQKLLQKMLVLYDRAPHSYPWAYTLTSLVKCAAALEASIRRGIAIHGFMDYHGQRVYAYEVDGIGNAIFMDDANVPSLLSLPFLGFLDASDPTYLATRRLLLSESNPWYFKGDLSIGGIGGPHIGLGYIWPMSLMVQAWTSNSVKEIAQLLQHLLQAAQPNSLMHESFNQDSWDNPTRQNNNRRLSRHRRRQRQRQMLALYRSSAFVHQIHALEVLG